MSEQHQTQPARGWGETIGLQGATNISTEVTLLAEPEDERVWVPQAPRVWFRPLLLDTVTGQWCNLLRVRRSGVVNRHRHPSIVTGYVLRGRWHYLEHDWVAETGTFVYEPPGEVHTLVVPEGCNEMVTFFNVRGAMIYLDEAGHVSGYEDVHSKIDMCLSHYAANGLGHGYLEQVVR